MSNTTRHFRLPEKIQDLTPPVTREKSRYSEDIQKSRVLPFRYWGGLFLTSPFYYIDRYSDTFGRILGGGVLANDVFEASLIKNFGKLNPLQVRDGAAGEWVAFESGILLAGREFWFGPISYDECNHYSFLVKPNRFRVMTSSDCVLVLNSRFNMEEKLFDTPENVSLKIMANAANIENLAEIFDAVGIPKR